MSCLQTNGFSINHGKIVNIYIVQEIINIANINGNRDSKLTIENTLIGAVSSTKNADVDKYKYSGIEFYLIEKEVFHFQVVDMVKM